MIVKTEMVANQTYTSIHLKSVKFLVELIDMSKRLASVYHISGDYFEPAWRFVGYNQGINNYNLLYNIVTGNET